MSGIPSIESAARSTAARDVDRATLAVSKALQEKRREAAAMVRLIDGADASGKGRHVDFQA
jgi:polyphosphate kinase 2 (PPK2 family)